MHKLTGLMTLFYLAGASLNAAAVEVDVGNRRIDLPLPAGYVELTPEMSPYYETMKAFIAQSNTRYLTLISEGKADALLRGEDVDLERYMNVESEKGISAISVTSATFDELRHVMKTQLDDLVARANEQIPGIVEKGNASISKTFDADIAVELGGMVPLPIHLDTSNKFAYSMYLTVGTTTNGEKTSNEVVAMTMLALHLKDKVIFLYIYGPEPDIDWTREFATTWADDIVAANPLSAEETAAVETPGSHGIDWGRVLEKTAVGALIGGAIGILGLFFRRRKKE